MPRKQLAFGVDLNDLAKLGVFPKKKKAARKPTSLVLFEQVYKKCAGKCQLCGKHKKREDATIDHIKPVVKGGTHRISNMQILCFRCNSGKGRGTMAQAREKLGLNTPRKKSKVRKRKKAKLESNSNWKLPNEKELRRALNPWK